MEQGVDCGGTCPNSCVTTVSGLGVSSDSIPKLMFTIPAVAGRRVRITKVAICGDSDVNSGHNRYVASDGAGMSFSWSCGQAASPPPGGATYTLQPTPIINGNAHGFSYQAVDHLGAIGAPVTVTWDFHSDYDGHYCRDLDENGTSFDDSANPSSIRAWVKYSYQ